MRVCEVIIAMVLFYLLLYRSISVDAIPGVLCHPSDVLSGFSKWQRPTYPDVSSALLDCQPQSGSDFSDFHSAVSDTLA